MAGFNLFLKEVPLNEWTVEPSGTALEAVGKEAVEPSAASTTKKLKSPAEAGKKFTGKITIPAGLTAALEAGEKIVSAQIHLNAKASGAAKQVKLALNSPAVTGEPAFSTTNQEWVIVTLTKAQAEGLTKATLEALIITVERLLGTPGAYELYLSLTTEATGAKTQTLNATVSFTGGLPRTSLLQLPATVSFTGGVSRLVSRAIAATVSFTGSAPRAASRALAATLSFTGALRRAVATTQHAALSFAGGLPRLVARKLTAALTFTGALLPAETGHFVQHLTAALSFQGALPRATSRALQATATFTGGLPRASARALHGTLTFAGSVPRATARTLHATLTFTGVLGRGVLRGLRAGLTWAGQLLPGGKVEPGVVSLLDAPRSSVLLTDQALGTVALSAAPATRALLSDALVDPG